MKPPDGLERPFAEPWEAHAFAMAVKLNERGVFTWTEWAEALGAELRRRPDQSYYECWLAALERLAEARGLMTPAERHARIDAWDRAARATPHGQPIELSRTTAALETSRAATMRRSGAPR